MSQELTSAKFYREPQEQQIPVGGEGAFRTGNALRVTKVLGSLVLWGLIIGGGCFVACRAVWSANQTRSYTGNGAHPALSMLSYCMNLVDFDWDERVEDRIRKNVPPTIPSPDVADIDIKEGPLIYPGGIPVR